MKKLKSILASALALLTVGVCASCNNASSGGKAMLKIQYSNAANSEQTLANNLKKAFVKKMADEGVIVDVRLVGVTMGPGYNQNLMQGWQSGSLADVLFTQNDIVSRYARNGVYADLTEKFTAENFNFSECDEMAFADATVDDKIYFAPRTIDQPVIFLNKDLFAKYGVDVPTYGDDWTWTKLVSVMSDLREGIDENEPSTLAKTIVPMDVSISWGAFYDAFVRSFGGYVYNADNNSVGFTQEGTQNAFEKIQELIKNKYIPAQGGQLFVNQKAAMYVASRASVATLQARGNTNVAFLPIPVYDDAFTGLTNGTSYYSYGATGWALNSKSKKKDIAWKFLQFVLSEEGQEIMSSTGSVLPVKKSMQTAEDASWKTCFDFLKGVDQSAFVFSSTLASKYTRIPAAYAKSSKSTKAEFESSVYTQVESSINSLGSASKLAEFLKEAQSDLETTVR
jgi:multiple sugar transport system substrate-binding protein